MSGVITTRDLFAHGFTILSEFGVRAYVRCLRRTLFSHERVTFLQCIGADVTGH